MRSSKVPNQKRRRREQLYVFFILESPLNDGLNYSNTRFIINHCISSTCRFKSFFNLTMTYRRDSDLVRPYGWISPLRNPPNSLQQPTEFHPSENLKRNPPTPKVSWLTPTSPSQELQRALGRLKKPKLVAWIASNCDTHSDREDFVEQLRKHIKVVFQQFHFFPHQGGCVWQMWKEKVWPRKWWSEQLGVRCNDRGKLQVLSCIRKLHLQGLCHREVLSDTFQVYSDTLQVYLDAFQIYLDTFQVYLDILLPNSQTFKTETQS